jgi:hypothetical protein
MARFATACRSLRADKKRDRCGGLFFYLPATTYRTVAKRAVTTVIDVIGHAGVPLMAKCGRTPCAAHFTPTWDHE